MAAPYPTPHLDALRYLAPGLAATQQIARAVG